MATIDTGSKTHLAVLPQRRALESKSVDNPGVGTKQGLETGVPSVPGVDHCRGEIREVPHHELPGRHGKPSSSGDSVTTGSDSRTTQPNRKSVPGETFPKVFVLDRHGKPLMPCHPARVRELLRKGRARVHRMSPFTIRIIDRTVEESEASPIVVKIDPGSKHTGIALARVDEKNRQHGLFAVQLDHRGDRIRNALHTRAALRRGRRGRNTRHRQPRFNNRTRPPGWLAPSLQHRVDTALSWVERLRRLAPITGIDVETMRFDTQALQNPEITGVQYQRGTLRGFEVREYLLEKWRLRCAYCDATGVPLNIDHVRPRARGGSDRVSNLVISCIGCNDRKGTQPVEVFVTDPQRLKTILAGLKAPLRDAAVMNSTRASLHRELLATGLPVITGSGGLTKWNRSRFGLGKSHTLDALCVGDLAGVAAFPRQILVAGATGRGSYKRTVSDRHGFTRLIRSRVKRQWGFATGDQVLARVPFGKNAGIHRGRVRVRSSGYFDIVTAVGKLGGVPHRYCQLLSRGDGYSYSIQSEGTVRQ